MYCICLVAGQSSQAVIAEITGPPRSFHFGKKKKKAIFFHLLTQKMGLFQSGVMADGKGIMVKMSCRCRA